MFDPEIVEAVRDVLADGACISPCGVDEPCLCRVDAETTLTALCAHLRITPKALADLAAGKAAVVNKSEVICEAEAERIELFNRLGRITDELGLPVDATASRIIEAIDTRVDDEREACASLDVRVEVPPDAETWTPLEAWEEALIALNKAWRDAVRNRAASPYAQKQGGSDA